MTKANDNKLTGRIICAWCGADLGPSGTVENSHGICQQCKEKYFPKQRKGDSNGK